MYNYPINADIDKLQIVVEYKYIVRNSVLHLFWSSVHIFKEKKHNFPFPMALKENKESFQI